MKKAVAYLRVSTKNQAKDEADTRHGLDGQQMRIEEYAERNGLDIIATYSEVETGTDKRRRKDIYQAIKDCQDNDAVLLIADLSRLGRSHKFLSYVEDSNIDVIPVDSPDSWQNPTIRRIMMEIHADYARAVRKGTLRGLDAARAKGIKLGNDGTYLTDDGRQKGAATMRRRARAAYSLEAEIIDAKREKGWTYRKIAEYLNGLKGRDGKPLRTRQGKAFQAMTVKRIYERLEVERKAQFMPVQLRR